MAEVQNRSLFPSWLADVETCARVKASRPRPDLKGAWMWVDAGVAEALLAMNTDNRTLRAKRVSEYAELMRNGLWDEHTPQMIVFDADMRMADGQHRCYAIIASGHGFWCLVVWGIPPRARLNIDRGGTRNSADNVLMAGNRELIPGDPKRVLELANAFVQGMRPTKVSLGPAAFQAVLEQYGEVFARVHEVYLGHSSRSFFARATVRALVARALHHGVSQDALIRFVELLVTGFSSGVPGDRAVIALRNEYIREEGKGKGGGYNSNVNAQIYAKCAWALQCFLRGEDRVTIRPASSDPFPIKSVLAEHVNHTGDVARDGDDGLVLE